MPGLEHTVPKKNAKVDICSMAAMPHRTAAKKNETRWKNHGSKVELNNAHGRAIRKKVIMGICHSGPVIQWRWHPSFFLTICSSTESALLPFILDDSDVILMIRTTNTSFQQEFVEERRSQHTGGVGNETKYTQGSREKTLCDITAYEDAFELTTKQSTSDGYSVTQNANSGKLK